MTSHRQQFYYKNNRLQQLRGFCYAAQFGHISKAAAHMGLLPSSVSLQIKALEDDLGIRLFERFGPRIQLNQEGQKLFDLARPHIEGIDNLLYTFRERQQIDVKCDITISANATSKSFLLPRVITAYLKKFPDHNVTLHDAEHDTAMDLLMTDKVDCAVLPWRAHKSVPEDIIFIPTYLCKPCLITHKDHPLAGRANLSVDEILQYDLVLPGEEVSVIPNLHDVFLKGRKSRASRLQFANGETGRAYVEQGLVITVSSNVWIGDVDPVLMATPVGHLFPDINYGYFLRRQQEMVPKIRSLIDLTRDDARMNGRACFL